MATHIPRPRVRRLTDRHLGELIAYLTAMAVFTVAVLAHLTGSTP